MKDIINTRGYRSIAQLYSLIKLAINMFSLIFITVLHGQSQELKTLEQDSKIFQKDQIEVLKSNYLDKNGNYSYDVFLKKNGLYRFDQIQESIPYFKISILKKDLILHSKKLKFKNSVHLLNLDFYIENNTTYRSFNQASPLWDSRVYLEDNQIIIGGYSSDYNERPIGTINEEGKFVKNLEGQVAENFSVLKIPSNELLFDPFKNQLLQLKPNKNKEFLEKTRQYLPIDLYSKQYNLLSHMRFELEYQQENSKLVLYGLSDGKKIEIATSNINLTNLTENKEAYRPELISGASQLGNTDILTLTFKGNYSKGIELIENELFIKSNQENAIHELGSNIITMDGDFSDWRNIKGVNDVQGDYVNYLYNNPDTDLLEFKLTNDSKYIYFYTRVSGAHGRTGDKGRYYWYTYIDVDQKHKTGYPPTRDDNCYFGVAIGDDSEAQFEFVANKFVKTFFGFTGIGTEQEVLNGQLKIGPSFYAKKDSNGKPRDYYKMEYVNRNGSRFLTEDYTEGTSEDIIIALSPDGSEVEVRVEMAGFLKDQNGDSLMYTGKKIDIAVGVEASSDFYGSKKWGADSSPIIYGYLIK